MTVIDPVRMLVMATAIVTESTNRHSCSVDLKHAGRAFGSFASCSLVGVSGLAPILASVDMFGDEIAASEYGGRRIGVVRV